MYINNDGIVPTRKGSAKMFCSIPKMLWSEMCDCYLAGR